MDWSIIFKYKSSVNWGLNCGLATERGIKNPITFAFYLRKFKFVKGLRKKNGCDFNSMLFAGLYWTNLVDLFGRNKCFLPVNKM